MLKLFKKKQPRKNTEIEYIKNDGIRMLKFEDIRTGKIVEINSENFDELSKVHNKNYRLIFD